MTVLSTSYDAKVSAAICAMLAACAAFQTAMGKANATVALDVIVEDDAGHDPAGKQATSGATLSVAGSWAVVRLGPTRTVDRAAYTWGREGTAQIMIVLRPTAGDIPSEVIRRARNLQGDTRDQFEAQFGGVGKIAAGTIEAGPIAIDDTLGVLQNAALIPFNLSWRDLP